MSTTRDYLACLKRDASRFEYCTLVVFVKGLTYGVASDDPKALAKLGRLLARGGQPAGIMGHRQTRGIGQKGDNHPPDEGHPASTNIVKTVSRDCQWNVECVVLNGADMDRLQRLAEATDSRTDLFLRGFWCGSVEKGFADFRALERRNPGLLVGRGSTPASPCAPRRPASEKNQLTET